MNQSLTILVLPLDAWGHINPCIGIGQKLLRRGHRVVFAIEKLFEGKLIKYGFEEIVYSLNNKCMPENEQNWDAYSHKATIFTQASNYDKLKFFLYHVVMPKKLEFDSMYNQIEAKVKPDVLLVDNFLVSPSIIKNLPWINIFSSNLITHCDHEQLPPGGSGQFLIISFLCLINLKIFKVFHPMIKPIGINLENRELK